MMDCHVINDLLPMYVEQLTSEPSNDLIKEHIETCENCRRILAELKNGLVIANPVEKESSIEAVPIQLIKRIKKNIFEKTIVLASIALAAGILIGILSSSPVMFMAFMAATSVIIFASSVLLSFAVCRKTSSMKKKYRRVGNWTFLFSLIVSCLLFLLFRSFFDEFAKIAIILFAVLICNVIFSSTLRIYAGRKLPKDDDIAAEPTNRRLYCVVFCTLLALTFLIAVPVTVLEKNRIVDNIDLPFENDPDLIGIWRSVDFVKSPEQFIPGQRSSDVSLFLKNMTFLESGKMKIVLDNPQGRRNVDIPKSWLAWTKGVVLNKGGDHTASKYILREIEGRKYLFFEWRSGDVIYFHRPPQYYVLEKEN